MPYKDFVTKLANVTGYNTAIIARVLQHIPQVLMEIPLNGNCKTPLGTFRHIERKGRTIKMPDGVNTAEVAPITYVRLNPGQHLRQET